MERHGMQIRHFLYAILLLVMIPGAVFGVDEVFSTEYYPAFVAKKAELDAAGIDYETEIQLGYHPVEYYTYIIRWESEPPPPRYDLSVATSGSGSVSVTPSGSAFDEGTSVTVRATPEEHWEFIGWSGDVSQSSAAIIITMSRDITLTATFRSIEEKARTNLDAATEAYDAFAEDLPPDFADQVVELADLLGGGGESAAVDLTTNASGESEAVAVELIEADEEIGLATEEAEATATLRAQIDEAMDGAAGADLETDIDGQLALTDGSGELVTVALVEPVVAAAGASSATAQTAVADAVTVSQTDAAVQADAEEAADMEATEREEDQVAEQTAGFSPTGGDPVRLATGEFVTSDSELGLRRSYVSSRSTVGAFGPAWASPVDAKVYMGVRPDHTALRDQAEGALQDAEAALQSTLAAQTIAAEDAATALAGAEAFLSLVAQAIVAHQTAVDALDALIADEGPVAEGLQSARTAERHAEAARQAVADAATVLTSIEETLPDVRASLVDAADAAAAYRADAVTADAIAHAAYLQATEVGNNDLAQEAAGVRDDAQAMLGAFDMAEELNEDHAGRLENLATKLPDQGDDLDAQDVVVADVESTVADLLGYYAAILDEENPASIPAQSAILVGELSLLEDVANTAAELVADAEAAASEVADLETGIAAIQDVVDRLSAALEYAEKRHAYSSSFATSRATGIGTVTLVTGDGVPVLYDIADEPAYSNNATFPDGVRNYYPYGVFAVPRIAGADRLYIDPDGGFRLLAKDGTVTRFDREGRLLSREEPNGRGFWYGYDSGNVAWIDDHLGRRTVLEWSGDRVISVEGPTGDQVHYGYDGGGRLASVTDEVGDTVRYHYDEIRLVAIEKPDGTARRYTYEYRSDAGGAHGAEPEGAWVTTSTTDEAGNTEYFAYDFETRVTTYTNPSGVTTVHRYNEQNREVEIIFADGSRVAMDYDSRGNLTFHRDQTGGVTRLYYDGSDNLIERMDPAGYAERWSYDAHGRVTRHLDALGNETRLFYDGRGNLTRYIGPDGAVTRYGYDDVGRVLWMIDPLGNRTDHEYNNADGPTRIIHPAVDGRRAEETFEYDAAGRVIRHADEAGVVTLLSYTADGRPASATRAGVLLELRSYSSRKDLVAVTDAGGHTTTYDYDPRHLLRSAVGPDGLERSFAYRSDGSRVEESIAGVSTQRYSYDERGLTVAVEQVETGAIVRYEYDAAGRITAVTDPVGNEVRREYTARGRLSRLIYADGSSVFYTYDAGGRVVTVTDEEGGVRRFGYDAAGRVTAVTDPLGNTHRFSYDAAGNLVDETDARGLRTRYAYDARGRLVRVVDPGGAATDYGYDQVGNLISVEEPEGGVHYYEYDEFERVLRAVDPTGVETLSSYDTRGNLISQTTGGGTWEIAYDEASRPVLRTDPYGNTAGYDYGPIGRVTQMTDPRGNTTLYSYNATGLPTTIVDSTGAETSFAYDRAGRLVEETGPTDITTSYEHDVRGRVVAATNGAGETTRFGYDRVGRTTSLTDPNGGEYRWVYDSAGRLIQEIDQLGVRKRYSYDAAGRPTEMVDFTGVAVTYGYDAAGRLISESASTGESLAFSYDGAGRLVEAVNEVESLSFLYDAAGRIVESQDAAGTTHSEYNGAGRRSAVIGPRGARTEYTYGDAGELVAVRDSSGRLTTIEYDALQREVVRRLPAGLRVEREYDAAGRLTAVRSMEGGHGAFPRVVSGEAYLYDEAGRRTFAVNHEGAVTAYGYDRAGRVTTVDYPLAGDGPAVRAADFGQMQRNGIFFFNDRIDTTEPAPGALSSLRYLSVSTSDASRLSEAYGLAAGVRKAGFSAYQQVWRQEFAYDQAGNRVSMATAWGEIDYSYDKARRMLSQGATTYSYDAAGNPVSESTRSTATTYSYNAWNRLASVDVENSGIAGPVSASVSYGYDALGRRVLREQTGGGLAKDAGGGADPEAPGVRPATRTRFSYDGTTMLISARRAEAGLTVDDLSKPPVHGGGRYRRPADSGPSSRSFAGDVTEYLRDGLVLIGEIDASPDAAFDPTYYVQDGLGSIRGAVTAGAVGGDLEDRFVSVSYDAFGRPLKGIADATSPTVAVPGPPELPTLGYNGKPYDTVTEHYDYGFRDYRPDSARFTTIDPIKDGYDWYAYVDHDPVNRIDLWGLDSVYATFSRAEQTMSVLYLVNDDHGMLVGVERYEYEVSNNVSSDYKPHDEDGNGIVDYYFVPRAFPAGTWRFQDSNASDTTNNGRSSNALIHDFLRTDAVDTWTTYQRTADPSSPDEFIFVADGTVTERGGHLVHGGGYTDIDGYSPIGNNNFQDLTRGCLRMKNQDIGDLQEMVWAAHNSAGNAVLIVRKDD